MIRKERTKFIERIGRMTMSVLLSLVLVVGMCPVLALPVMALDAVPYMDAAVDGTTHAVTFTQQNCTSYTTVTAGQTSWTTGWYVVRSNTDISGRITVTGAVNLILCDGAKLTVEEGITVANSNSLTIYGQSEGTGELYARCSYMYAVIGGDGKDDAEGNYLSNKAGTITINGGKVTARGDGVGIGSYKSSEAAGTLTINGGIVNATGGGEHGAGIGGSSYSDGFGINVIINGGEVTATGGENAAGIGAGKSGNGGNVTIHGGTVTATGGGNGAGIGGAGSSAQGGNSGTITITGGKVIATGGEWGGPGIGCSYGSNSGVITISGGTVTAAGIRGAGINCAQGSLTVSGGTVAAIGSGEEANCMGIVGPISIGTGRYLHGGDAADSTVPVIAQNGSYERFKYMEINDYLPHIHNFTYDASSATITATCSGDEYGCTLDGNTATLTIGAPTEDSNGAAVLTASANGVFGNLSELSVSYSSDGGNAWTAIAPTQPGFYRAKVEWTPAGGSTLSAQVTYGLACIAYEQGLEHGTVSGGVNAAVGETITPTVTPDPGYEPDAMTVTKDGGGTVAVSNGSFTMPEANVTVRATFKKANLAVTVNAPDHGRLAADKTTAQIGDTVTLTATPGEGYAFGAYAVTDASGNPVEVTGNTFTMPASGVTVSATFSPLTTYTVFYSVSGGPESVYVKETGADGDGYAMTNSAKVGDINCWATQILAAEKNTLQLSVKEGEGEWQALNIPVQSDVPSNPTAGTAVAVKGEVNAFAVAFVWGEDANEDESSLYYLVTSDTGSVTVQNPADREDEVFAGWRYMIPAAQEGAEAAEKKVDKGNGTTTVSLTEITGTTIVSAIWTPRTYSVRFDPSNGGAVTTETVTYGNTVTAPAAPTKEGYEFAGWVLAESAVEKAGDKIVQLSPGTAFDFDNIKIINSLSLKAKWKHVHSYVCLQLDNPAFGGAFSDYYGYKGQLHIRICKNADDYIAEAHNFVNGRCACGASIADNRVSLTKYTGGTPDVISAIKNSIVSISAPQKNGVRTFKKWQYSLDATNENSGNWTDLTTMRNVAFTIPADLSTRAVYDTEKVELSIRSFKYGDSHVAFQFNYSVPDGFTVVDGGLMLGDNVRMKFWDCTVRTFFIGNQYEPSLRDAVKVFGGRTIATKMFNYQTINEPGLARPIKKVLTSFGKKGTVALAWQTYTREGYMRALNTRVENDNYFQEKYPTYAMGYIICKTGNGGYVGFMTDAISATLQNPANSAVTSVDISN